MCKQKRVNLKGLFFTLSRKIDPFFKTEFDFLLMYVNRKKSSKINEQSCFFNR